MSALLAHLLRMVAVPHWAEQRSRTALTVLGVSLGVATVVGVADVSRSILASFREMVAAVGGPSELEVTSPGGDVDERLVDEVARTPGVEAAAGLVESFVPLADGGGESVYLLGIDFLGSPVWAEQLPRVAIDVPDEIVFLAQPDSVMLARRFAARAGIVRDGAIRVVAPGGVRTLHARGMVDDVPVTRLFDGMVAVMDLPAAQRLLGRDGRVDRIAVHVEPGASVDDVRARLAAALGVGVDVAPPEARGRQCEEMLFSLRSMLITASSLAVIVGALIVYQTVAVSVQQRRREFAIMNAVGVLGTTLIRLCLLETLVLAAAGAAVGVVGGRLLAAVAGGLVGDTASQIWLHLDVAGTAHSGIGTAAGIVVGVATALGAAYLAARAVFRRPTIEAMRPASTDPPDEQRRAWPVILAVLVIVGTWSIALVPPGVGFATIVGLVIATQAFAYGGAAVLGAPLVSLTGGLTTRLARSLPWLPARLAAQNLPRDSGRGGTTVATIAAALGMAVTLAGLVNSFERAWIGWMDHHFGGDLFVGSGAQFRLLAGPTMDAEVGARIAGVAGVATVEPFRVLPIELRGAPVFLQGIAVDDRLAHGGLAMVDGDLAAAAPALRAGTGVLLSDNLADRLRLARGDPLEIPTPVGPRTFRIEGTFVDYLGSLDRGAIGVAREQLDAVWRDRRANLYRVWLTPGASAASVRTAVAARLGRGYYVLTARDFVDGVRGVLDRFFLATWALQLIAALVAIIGVVNAQVATVLDRRVEIAMLRTIGVSQRDVSHAVLLECGALGVLGGVAGAVLGAMLGAQFVGISLRLVTGWRMPFILPPGPVAASLVCAATVSALAGYLPARAAARLEARQRSID